MAKLDCAIIPRASLVMDGIACTSLSLLQCSLNCSRILWPLGETDAGRLPLQRATMLETVVMIWVRFSVNSGDGVGDRTPARTA